MRPVRRQPLAQHAHRNGNWRHRTEANGQIIEYREKPILDYLVSMGIYVFAPEVRDFIPRGVKFDFDLVQRLLATNLSLDTKPHPIEGYWPP
jgi:NDP-sugar pyrophosphorylase family protein